MYQLSTMNWIIHFHHRELTITSENCRQINTNKMNYPFGRNRNLDLRERENTAFLVMKSKGQ